MELMKLSSKIGKILLKSGAEVSFVETAIERICQKEEITVDTFAIPTGIFITYEKEDKHTTIVTRIKRTSINFNKIIQINCLIERFENNSIDVRELEKGINEIESLKPYSNIIKIIFSAIAAGSFALLINGTTKDSIVAFGCCLLANCIVTNVSKFHTLEFINPFLLSAFITLSAIFCLDNISIFYHIDLSVVIASGVIPFVPGVAITNSIRDLLFGELVAGISKAFEAMIIASALAVGVAVVLQFTGNSL